MRRHDTSGCRRRRPGVAQGRAPRPGFRACGLTLRRAGIRVVGLVGSAGPMDNSSMDTALPSIDPTAGTWLDFADARRLLVDTYPGIVVALDPDGLVQWLNPAASHRLGYGRDELAGRAFRGSLVAREEIELHAETLAREFGEPVAAEAGVLTARLRRGAPGDEQGWVLRHKEGALQPARPGHRRAARPRRPARRPARGRALAARRRRPAAAAGAARQPHRPVRARRAARSRRDGAAARRAPEERRRR